MTQLLALPAPPTAVLTSNDLTAIGAFRAVTRVGLHVPDDISVVGFDDIELSRFTQPPLTTVRLSRDELGRKAFDALYEMVEGMRRGDKRSESTLDWYYASPQPRQGRAFKADGLTAVIGWRLSPRVEV